MNERVAVMLSEAGAATPVAEELARHDFRVECYTRLEELFTNNAAAEIPVLIFHVRRRPRGRVLEVIGRMAIEHPHVPMAMVSEEPVSLEIAEFLAGRGVSVVRAEPEDGEAVGLSGLVSRMHERRQRSLASS